MPEAWRAQQQPAARLKQKVLRLQESSEVPEPTVELERLVEVLEHAPGPAECGCAAPCHCLAVDATAWVQTG